MTAPVPANPDFAAAVAASFARQGLMGLIGARLLRVEPGLVEIALPFRPDLTQQQGFFHAGMIATVADNAGGYAALSLMPAGAEVVTVEFKINVMNPGRGQLLVARGRVAKAGRTLTVCTAEVEVVQDGTTRPCALMQQTLMRVAAG